MARKSRSYDDEFGVTKEMWKSIYYNEEIFKEKDRELLELIYEKGGMVSATEITIPYGLKRAHYNIQVGKLGRRVGEHFNINIAQRRNGTTPWWHVIFYGKKENDYKWEMRPELIELIKENK